MKRLLYSFLFLFSLIGSFTACSNQTMKSYVSALANEEFNGDDYYWTDTVKQTYDFSATPFTALQLPSVYSVNYMPTAGAYRVEVLTDSFSSKDLDIKVKEGTLIVGSKGKNSLKNTYAKITVYAPAIEQYGLLGTGDVTIYERLKVGRLSVLTTGTGDFRAIKRIVATEAKFSNSGTGDVAVDGLDLTGTLTVENTGTGDCSFNKLTAQTIVHRNSGTGDDSFGGKVKSLQSLLTGTGDLNVSGLFFDQKSITATGTGEVYTAEND